MKHALLAGSTGLIGNLLLNALLDSDRYDQVTALTRRPLERQHPRLNEVTAEFDRLGESLGEAQFDDVFCCLGTTIRSAGSQAAFEKVDFDYVDELARVGIARGAQQFVLVSAIGADPRSSVFYSRIKGRAEQAVLAAGYRTVHIFRPSLLLGSRREFRLGEKLMTPISVALSPLLLGGLKKYRPVQAATVARAMLDAASSDTTGPHIHQFDE